MVSAHDLDHLLTLITNAAIEIAEAESATIFVYAPKIHKLYFKVALGEKGADVKKYLLPIDDASIAGWIANHRESLIINDVSKDPRHYKKIDREVGYETRSVLGIPLLYQDELLGVIETINKKTGEFDPRDENYLKMLAGQAAIAIKNAQLIEDLRNFFVNGIELLITALESPAPTSGGHAFRVARTATAIARELGVKGKDYQDIYYAALLHDIGMLKLPFTQNPMNLRLHPLLGSELLSRIRLLEEVAPIIRYHHETFDGTGYPEGLKGDEIPLYSQILGLAENYDEEIETDSDYDKLENFIAEKEGKYSPKVLEAFKKISGCRAGV